MLGSQSRRQALVLGLFLLGFLLIGIRLLWEYVDPITPAEFKGWYYFRDVLTLTPAASCLYFGILRLNPHSVLLETPLQIIQKILYRHKTTAVIAAITAVVLTSLVSVLIFRTRAQILDEASYLFQAKIFATGMLWAPPPPSDPAFFELEYNIITDDKWYGSFFPGASLFFAIGIALGIPYLINPVLSGVLVLLTIRLGKKLYDSRIGVASGVALLGSSFFLFQGASYFSHVVTATFFTLALGWILTEEKSPKHWVGIGICVGYIALCRPLSAILLGLFFVILCTKSFIYKEIKLPDITKRYFYFALGFLPGVCALLYYNHALTGYWLLTPHEVALPNDRLALGTHVLKNTAVNLMGISTDLFGVPVFSLVPVGVWILSRDRWRLHVGLLSIIYIFGYGLYGYHGLSYGPRFYYELLPLWVIISVAGVRQIAINLSSRRGHDEGIRYVVGLVTATLLVSIFGHLPPRVWGYAERGNYYDIRPLVNSLSAPALVFIGEEQETRLFPYMAGFQLNDVYLQGKVIFARDLGARNAELLRYYPNRRGYLLSVGSRRIVPLDAPYERSEK